MAIAGMAAGWIGAPRGLAQSAVAPLRFEVATIKPTKADGTKGGLEILPGGGLRMGGATVKGLIAMA